MAPSFCNAKVQEPLSSHLQFDRAVAVGILLQDHLNRFPLKEERFLVRRLNDYSSAPSLNVEATKKGAHPKMTPQGEWQATDLPPSLSHARRSGNSMSMKW